MNPLEPNSPLGRQVRVTNPGKGHEHMQGWVGRMVTPSIYHPVSLHGKRPTEWVVRFIGGSGIFAETEWEVID